MEKEHSEPKKMATSERESQHPSQHVNQQSQPQHHQIPAQIPNSMMQHHQMPRDRDPPPGPAPSINPNQPDTSHLMHPLPGQLERPQPPRFMDHQINPYGFRHSSGDLIRPHAAFSPANFPPRGTPTSLTGSIPGFPQGVNGFPSLPGMPPGTLENFLMQYQLYNSVNNFREQEERERERERERQNQELRRLTSSTNSLDQCLELQRRMFANQHPGYPNAGAAGINLPPPGLHNPGGLNPALSGMMLPPGEFNERLPQERLNLPDTLFRNDLNSAMAALNHLNVPHDGLAGLGLPPPQSQSDSMGQGPPNPLLPPGFPGAAGIRPMMPGRDFLLPPGLQEQNAALHQLNLQQESQRQADFARQYYNY